VRLWQSATGEPLGPLFQHPTPIDGLAFDSSGRIAVARGRDGTTTLWAVATGKRLGLPVKGFPPAWSAAPGTSARPRLARSVPGAKPVAEHRVALEPLRPGGQITA